MKFWPWKEIESASAQHANVHPFGRAEYMSADMNSSHHILSGIKQRNVHVILLVPVICSLLVSGCNELPAPPIQKPTWLTFTRRTVPALPNDRITTMYLARDNTVWIGTNYGAVCYKKGWTTLIDSLQYLIYNKDNSTTLAATITAIAQGKDGSIWFGTAGGGLRRYNPAGAGKTWVRYSRSTDTDFNGRGDISDNTILSIAAMWTGLPAYVYVGSISGIDRYVPDLLRPINGTWDTIAKPLLPDSSIEVMGINQANNMICFGTKFNGAAFLDESTNFWTYYKFPTQYDYPICNITFDPWSSMVWLAKWEGVTRYDLKFARDSNFTHDNTNGALPTGIVHAVAIQATGSTWFGTDKGLVHYTGTTWVRYTQATVPALPSDIITALIFDYSGNLWIGTTSGIAVYNPNGIIL